jgi:C4-dicarboxylate-specific signal transduction histidine kinase
MSGTSNVLLVFLIVTTVVSIGALLINIKTTGSRIRRIHEDYREKLGKITRDRDAKLFSQSKYSELGMMSAGIAHEINNPLAVIQARTTQLLRMYRDPGRLQELGDGLQQILYTSERINRTVQGIREFIRHDDKTPDQEIPLKKIVDDVLAFCGQRMKNHGVNLRIYNIEGHKVIGNKVQIEQIFLNLLNNAFDAIEFLPEKWIEISVHEANNKLQVFVKDSGKGIPPEIASKIMEPFYSTKDSGKGTGLGLALASGIAEKHGGALTYVPKANHTTFLVEFPKPRSLGEGWHRQNASVNSKELH